MLVIINPLSLLNLFLELFPELNYIAREVGTYWCRVGRYLNVPYSHIISIRCYNSMVSTPHMFSYNCMFDCFRSWVEGQVKSQKDTSNECLRSLLTETMHEADLSNIAEHLSKMNL